jgi:hypothetical protein
VIAGAPAARPGVVVSAAGLGRVEAVELLVPVGFDLNALGGPTSFASSRGRPLCTPRRAPETSNWRTLLALGADVTVRDRRFDATPRDWTDHFGRTELVELLGPAE